MATLKDTLLQGDLTSTHPIYPGYNGGSVGVQGSYYLYGDTGNSGIRTNGNFLVNGNIYFGWAGQWLSSWINQNVRTDSGPTFADVYTNGWFRNNNNNQGLYNQANGTHFYSNSASTWGITGSGGSIELQFRSNHQSTVRGYVYGDTNSNFGLLSSDGSWSVRVNNSEVELYHVTYADDMRANIYYDRANTGYYLDPASTSNLNAVNTTTVSAQSTSDATGVSFRQSYEVISGESWALSTYAYNQNDGFLWLNRDSGGGQARPVFHIGGKNNASYGGWAAEDSIMTLVRTDGVKSASGSYADKGLSTSAYYTNIVKTTTATVFRDAQGRYEFTGATAGADVLAVNGVNGRLFTVTDDLSDSLFSVNTIAGLPVMEVFADNSIVLGKFGVSDPGTTYANGTIKVKAKENDYGISIIGDYMAGMSFYANKDDGYYASQNARLGWVGIYQGNLWFQSAAPAQYSAPQHYFDGPVYASIIYDSNDNGYYVNPNSTSRLGTVNANELRSYGNTYLGDGSGDETHINDIVRIGATDSGDAHLFFGEGGAAGSDYGAHWYWDSGYTFTWNTRNAGSDTALFTYVTNATTYVNWFRHFNMGGKELNYVGQVHFNSDGPILQRNNNRNLVVKGGSSSDVGIVGLDAAGNNRFQIYGAGSEYGFLDGTWAAWDLRKVKDGNLYMNDDSTYYLNTNSTSYLHQLSVNQNLYLDNNYGSSIVGVYSSTRYQGVWAMGNAYKLALDGTSTGTLYGLAWTHTNVGGQSKSGLGHQLLIMDNGTTTAAIGNGIWTSGTITTTSHGTSANWKQAYDWGNHANAGYITGSGSISGNAATATYATSAGSADNIDGWAFVNTGSNNATNADTINSNGISYYTGGVTNFSGNATDGALYSQRYSDAWQHQIAGDYRSGQIALRGKNNGTWQAWRTVLDSSNFANYAATSGHNHNGTYLGVSDKAADSNLLDGLDLHTGRNNEANKVVRTDSNGYIQAGWINTTSGNNGTTTIDRIYASHDGYIRYYTPANFRAQITDGIYQPAGSYAASSHTHTPSQVGLGNVSNAAQVTTAYNSSLNSDSRNSRGVTRLYRRDDDSDYSVQTYWTGSHWFIRGYSGDSFHAEARVGYADNAGTAGAVAWDGITSKPTTVSGFGITDMSSQSVNYANSAGSASSAGTSSTVTINYNNNSNSTYQMLWGSGTSVYGTGNIYCNPSSNYIYAAAFYDSDNTGYYLNPNGYSNLYTARAYEWQLHAGAGYGVRFWGGSSSYSIQMSESGNGTWGGRVAGETTSDYNMYFTMTGGTNRGFVFRNSVSSGGAVAGIDAGGNFRCIGDAIIYSSSDARLKKNVKPIENALDKVMQINGVEFDWDEVAQDTHKGHDVGVIAQEVETVLPEIVHTRDNGYKAVKYEKLVALLIESVKELQAEVESLKAQINK